VRERLIMKRDRRAIDPHAHRLAQLQRRQLPQPAEQPLRRAPRQHQHPGRFDPHQRPREDRQLRLLLARGDHRQLVLAPRLGRRAFAHHGAHQAARLRRRADRRAELHQPLVQRPGRGPRRQRLHQLTRRRPQRLAARGRLDVVLDREHPRQHPRDVAVDQRRPLAERDRRDRPGGIRADPGHLAQLGGARRQRPAELRIDRPCPGMQVARARVVAEPGPRGEHVVQRRVRQRRHGGKLRHPALPVRDHRCHPGLLQHDLADPDRIRVAGPPPRQVALDPRVVRHHRGRDRLMPAHATSYPARAAAATAASTS